MKLDAAAPPEAIETATSDPATLTARVAVLEAALARLAQEVEMLKALERHRDAILERHPVASQAALARSVRVEAQEFLTAGSGFYQLEQGANGIAYRWIGPDPEARIVVWVDRRFPLSLRFCCHNFGRSRFIRILVDDQEFQVSRQEGAQPIQVGPLAPRPQLGPTEIRIQPEVMFQPGGPEGPDKRTLGTTFLWLELAPVE